MLNKSAETSHPIHPLLRDRWSPRAYAQAPVPGTQILSLLEAARWSPSGGNGQPWSFIVIPRADEEDFARAVSCLMEGNVIWAQQAPLLIIAVAQTMREGGVPNTVALYDLGQAVAHLSVQAAALNLWVHQMGGFSQEKARAAFEIPEGFAPVTFIAIGEQGELEALPPALREREAAPRSRKPLDTFVFGAKWGDASPLLESAI